MAVNGYVIVGTRSPGASISSLASFRGTTYRDVYLHVPTWTLVGVARPPDIAAFLRLLHHDRLPTVAAIDEEHVVFRRR
jgi:hypothetical protein